MNTSTNRPSGENDITELLSVQKKDTDIFGNKLLEHILFIVQDGISFLSANMDLLYGNPTLRKWYSDKEPFLNKKCYAVFHSRTSPCPNCPALKSAETGHMEISEQPFERFWAPEGTQQVYCAPIRTEQGDILLFVEYIRDTTSEKVSVQSVELLQDNIQTLLDTLEKKAEAYTALENQMFEKNEKKINSVLRLLSKLLSEEEYAHIRRQFDTSLYGIHEAPSNRYRLSEKELQVARYIADGYLSKEIADIMNTSKKTVDYYRTNLRKKLKLAPNDNLKISLQNMMKNPRS